MKIVLSLCLLIILLPDMALAGPEIVEGDKAKIAFSSRQEGSKTLSQINKVFVLKDEKGDTVETPTEIDLKDDAYLFITNDEETTVHNVYDATDHSWVLKKQMPGGVAAVKFNKSGVHELRCAIHPQMKVKVNVTAAETKK